MLLLWKPHNVNDDVAIASCFAEGKTDSHSIQPSANTYQRDRHITTAPPNSFLAATQSLGGSPPKTKSRPPQANRHDGAITVRAARSGNHPTSTVSN